LNYTNEVRVNLPDCQLVGIPAIDKVIQKSDDVKYPYYRADSYMGSVYISEPGKYNIQVISEMVISKASEKHSASLTDKTKLMGIILTPAVR
jgi:phenolic acid decarboxylase